MPAYIHELHRRLQLIQITHLSPDQVDDLPSWEASWYIELDNLRKKHEAGNGF